MNSNHLCKLIVVLAALRLISPLIAGSPSSGGTTSGGSMPAASLEGTPLPSRTDTGSLFSSTPNGGSAASTQSGQQGNGGLSAPSGSYYGRDAAASGSGQAAGAGARQAKEKVSEVDARTLQTSATDRKFQQSLLDVGLKSDPKSAKVSASANAGGEKSAQQKATSTDTKEKSSAAQNSADKH